MELGWGVDFEVVVVAVLEGIDDLQCLMRETFVLCDSAFLLAVYGDELT